MPTLVTGTHLCGASLRCTTTCEVHKPLIRTCDHPCDVRPVPASVRSFVGRWLPEVPGEVKRECLIQEHKCLELGARWNRRVLDELM
jgi:hypothetical protein